MIEHHLDIPTADGAMNTFVVHPDEGGPHPVVLFYMDAPGKREELHDMARRLATVGYCVVLPNLYYRRTRDYWLQGAHRGRRWPRCSATCTRSTPTPPGCDTQAMLDFVDGLPAADASRIGAVGYCMSGPFVVWAAAAFPERLRCIASIYGANMVTDAADSPHQVVGQLRCESYFACAEHRQVGLARDRWPPAGGAAGRRAPHRLEWYPGAQHGFAFPLRAGIYDKPSAERHWARLFTLFARHLQPA